jgi:hypothetical protein
VSTPNLRGEIDIPIPEDYSYVEIVARREPGDVLSQVVAIYKLVEHPVEVIKRDGTKSFGWKVWEEQE